MYCSSKLFTRAIPVKPRRGDFHCLCLRIEISAPPADQINYATHPAGLCADRLTKRLTTFLSLVFTDTFQALIQYPDVVTAQAAKLVSLFPRVHKIWHAQPK